MRYLVSVSSRRRGLAFGLVFGSCMVLLFLSTISHGTRPRMPSFRFWLPMVGGNAQTTPPTYDKIIQEEKNLPQHNLSLPFPEGKHGRYVKFSNQIKALGWNNVLNEILLCNHLAWRTRRAYVFQDYLWKPEYYPWRIRSRPSPRTPLSALIAGPTAGGPWDEGDDMPRSIREDHWNKVCTRKDTEVINTYDAKDPIRWADATTVLEHWVRILNESPKRCVEIVGKVSKKDSFPQTFDLWTISTPRILSLWPEFRDSPVSRLLKTSPLVNSAIERNEHLFLPPVRSSATLLNRYGTTMAIHLRRGDYLGACQGLSDYNSTFYEWNLLPELPDVFTPPPGGSWGKNTPENEAIYFERCFPTEDQLISKIQQSKRDWETGVGADGRHKRLKLDSLYIMTNAEPDWVDGFKRRLLSVGWKRVVASADLELDEEQTSVGMAIDMDIGRRAAVFIGNGWSSLTSNVVHRRLVDGNEALSVRFW